MIKESQHILGIMSGTSCDGLDFCLSQFSTQEHGYEYTILKTHSFPYTKEWRERLEQAFSLSGEELKRLEFDFTHHQIKCIQLFQELYPELTIDVISTHGHTVFHNPGVGYTFQMTLGGLIAEQTKLTTVCNFREQDVFLGGQGAPLVPIGDLHLFSEYDACINLGGFANISVEKSGQRIAYDLCPFNILMNKEAVKLGKPYDCSGMYAESGQVMPELLEDLNQLEYYQKLPPKSLSVEDLNTHYFKTIETHQGAPEDILATLSAHYGSIISQSINHCENVLLTGGGVFNSYFVNNLKNTAKSNIHIPNNDLIEFKESLIFAFLGYLRLRNEVNVLSSVTGSRTNHSSGQIYYPIL